MRKRKIFISVLLVFLIAVIGVGCYVVFARKANAAVSNQEIVLEKGQELLYAKITSISGNEMTYAVVEAQTVDLGEMGNGRGRGNSKQNTGGRSSSDNMSSGGGRKPSNDNMSSGGERSFGGQMPSGNFGGGMPSGDFNGGMPSNNQNEQSTDEAAPTETQDRTMTTYTETGEAGQIQIPVGTEVETKLGTITTFSRLSNGDIIRMLLQNESGGGEDLLKIWIVE